MKTLSWNVRGLGKLRAIRLLSNKLREVRPHVMFLLETKISSNKMQRVRRRCGFVNGFDVSAEGSRGGLSLGWTPNLNATIRPFSNTYIDVDFLDTDSNTTWRFTGFYGSPIDTNRNLS
ncbi:hypothetical protein HRI_005072300 [Hibiscus trionum]|uniref:Endonuclease/exonuclease/phosphatase domain-containing protein n=1 Tax=Hibiscus trionum TaxID=183268 RepID=A0A9W7JEL6_HIBTR|nr:hypothetical protein HRI_005072300 [Hibiscus trionum]